MLQELYEEKLVTYPRTDSQFVTEDMKDSVEELVEKMPVLLSFVDYGQLGHGIKRVINNAKVSITMRFFRQKKSWRKELLIYRQIKRI